MGGCKLYLNPTKYISYLYLNILPVSECDDASWEESQTPAGDSRPGLHTCSKVHDNKETG